MSNIPAHATPSPAPAFHWPVGPQQPFLKADQVHIWCAHQAILGPHLSRLSSYLSVDESARAERFAFEHLRRRFTASRGLLRLLLSRYTHLLPEKIAFSYNPQGKPSINNSDAANVLHFNVSHTDDVVLIGVALQHPIGIDLEALRPMTDMIQIARRFFAPAEYKHLEATPEGDHQRLFFRYWVQKEAYIKAIGLGLSFAPNRFTVSVGGDTSPVLVSVDGSSSAAHGWHLAELHPASGFIGALAIKMESPRLNCWQVHL